MMIDRDFWIVLLAVVVTCMWIVGVAAVIHFVIECR